MDENWKVIPGYENLYEVSDHGSIRSLVRATPRIMKQSRNTTGYYKLDLRRDGKASTQLVHRLVLLTFTSEPPEGKNEACHIDGDQLNNHIDNLRWGSRSENTLDSIGHKTHANANKTACPRGHEYTDETLYVDSKGFRSCKICRQNLT